MTSKELYSKIKPDETRRILAQLGDDGLEVNMSTEFSQLIKDAARCNHYNSDVYYDIKGIHERFKEYDGGEFDPIWIGFRRMGVDGTSYVLARVEGLSTLFSYYLSSAYFALYSVMVEKENDNYVVCFNEYFM